MFLIAIYLYFIVVESYKLNIAYFEDSGHPEYSTLLLQYETKHPNIKINYVTVTSPTTVNYDKAIKGQVENNNVEIIIAQCDDYLLNSTSEYILEDKVLVICMNEVSVGRCNKHFISGVTVIPLIMNCINYEYIIS